MSQAHRRTPAGSWAGYTLALLIASHQSFAANWESIPTFSGSITIELDTLGQSPRIAGAIGVWVRYSPTLSVDCAPPRGCYAATQRLYYDFSCMPRFALLMERISFDLNGTVLKHELLGTYAVATDEAANRVMTAFCGSRDRD